MSGDLWKVALVAMLALPSFVLRFGGGSFPSQVAVIGFGAAIISAAFLLTWAAEAAQLDISANAATALLALVAVLPEYAIDIYFAFTSGHRPAYTAYAAATMTGSNRLLIGIGWPLASILFALITFRRGNTAPLIRLPPSRRIDLAFLAVAAVYAFSIPLKRSINLIDALVFIAIFVGYLIRTSQQPRTEPELRGLTEALADLPPAQRKGIVLGFFSFAALLVAISAKPFADALIESGRRLHVNEFLAVQWIAPLSSETPELLVAAVFAARGEGDIALGTLLSSKVNQWTLLVGSLPVAHLIGGGGFSLPLDARQSEEFFLTAAQALFAVTLLLRLRFRPMSALLLFAAFVLQLWFPSATARIAFGAFYLLLTSVVCLIDWEEIVPTLEALRSQR